MTGAPLVLVVEDQPQIARAVARQLGSEFSVVLAKDAPSAIALAQEREDIAAVVSDWALGDGGSGVDVLEWFRRTRPAVPRVLFSAHVPPDLGPQIVAGSVQRYVAKPPRPDELRDTLRELLS
ncbi:MAG: response regulator [Myxococcaceae bacterium]|nr:response regulator [Myxococcaceae bacterium]